MAPAIAAEEARPVAREILRAVGATIQPCPQEARDAFPDRELLCATYSREFSFFKLDWETTLGRFDLRSRVAPVSPWALRQGSYVRDYEAGEAKLTVSFNEPSGRLVAAFTPPDDDERDAALVSEEEFSSRALSRDARPMAGFDGVSTPVPIPESRVEPALPERAVVAGVEGEVTLQLLVLRDGTVGEVRVLRVDPEGWGFGEAAVDAMRQWLFEPARREDEPVDAWFTVFHQFEPG
jgi:TonB family protein